MDHPTEPTATAPSTAVVADILARWDIHPAADELAVLAGAHAAAAADARLLADLEA